MSDTNEKFATEVNRSVETQTNEESLPSVEIQAEQEEQQTPAVANEVSADLLDPRKNTKIRPQVLEAYKESLEIYGELYEKLAK